MTQDELFGANALHREHLEYKALVQKTKIKIEALTLGVTERLKIEQDIDYWKVEKEKRTQISVRAIIMVDKKYILQQLRADLYRYENLMKKFKLELNNLKL